MAVPTALRHRLQTKGLPLFWGLWLAGLLGFALMAAFAAAFSHFPADIWLTHRLQDVQAVGFVRAVDWAEDGGDAPIVIAAWALVVAGLWLAGGRMESLLTLATIIGRGLNLGLKDLISRPRPSDDLVRLLDGASGFAFPSGHATGALIFYGFLFYLATVLIGQPLLRLLIQLGCLYVVLFTALERVYVGAHWPSDILGSFLFGGLFLALLIWIHRRWRGGGQSA